MAGNMTKLRAAEMNVLRDENTQLKQRIAELEQEVQKNVTEQFSMQERINKLEERIDRICQNRDKTRALIKQALDMPLPL